MQRANQKPATINKYWQYLFRTQLENLEGKISKYWQNGFNRLGYDPNQMFDTDQLNRRSNMLTGWTFLDTDLEFSDPEDWIEMQAKKQMPLSNFVRTPEELYYCDEPDKFHDIFGHVTFLMDPEYSEMYKNLGQFYLDVLATLGPEKAQQVENMIWYLTEVGLIKEDGQLKALGTTLYSSSGELGKAFADPKKIQKFSWEDFLKTDQYDRKDLMERYYYVDSLQEINDLQDQYRQQYFT